MTWIIVLALYGLFQTLLCILLYINKYKDFQINQLHEEIISGLKRNAQARDAYIEALEKRISKSDLIDEHPR